MLTNVAWHALTTEHARLSVSSPLARRYPADVVPISALKEHCAEALAELRGLLQPGEDVYVAWTQPGDLHFPECSGIEVIRSINAWQMSYPEEKLASDESSPGLPPIEKLNTEDGPEMVALTDVAFPGFFRAHTYRMGSYWGIRSNGQLIAMAGERLAVPGLREVSAVCTHPEHTGLGYAARLIRHVLAVHATAGLRSFLHVSDFNHRAIALYERLGFERVGATQFTQIRRTELPAE
ncbi:MAG TPA: GNAT family N-acetyltransferase [Terriglobales bacterium]|jgi:ribosomal protein S18 acetylase RimI-like enzyme